MDEHLVDDGLVLVQPVTQFRQKKSWRLGGGTENAFHPLTRQPPQRLLERLVLGRPLELEQVEVAAIYVDVEGIDALRDVFSEGDVARHLVGALVELSCQVEQREIVLLASAVLNLVLCVRLFEIAISNTHTTIPLCCALRALFRMPFAPARAASTRAICPASPVYTTFVRRMALHP